MSDKDNKDFTAEQQKFLLEEFRELHKKIEETQKRQEALLNKIADNINKLTEILTRLETRLNTLLTIFPDVYQKGKGGENNLWIILGQIVNTILMLIALLKIFSH